MLEPPHTSLKWRAGGPTLVDPPAAGQERLKKGALDSSGNASRAVDRIAAGERVRRAGREAEAGRVVHDVDRTAAGRTGEAANEGGRAGGLVRANAGGNAPLLEAGAVGDRSTAGDAVAAGHGNRA